MKVLTTTVNNPVFIELQYKLLQRYMPVDIEYEFIVFNDAKTFPDKTNQGDIKMTLYIQNICKKYNIQCISIPNEQHQNQQEPSIRCADSMNFILEYQKNNPNEYIVLDSDMFPIAPIPIHNYRQYNTALLLQERKNQYYFWHGIFYWNTHKMTNMELMNWNCMPGFDTGGKMFEWLQLQKPETIYNIPSISSLSWTDKEIPSFLLHSSYETLLQFIQKDPRNVDNRYFCEIYDNTYLHYRGGSNWRNEGIAFHIHLTLELRHCLMDSPNSLIKNDNNLLESLY